jgi:uncharacterized protein with GYD domain
MATYVVLMNWTDRGIQKFEDSPSRAELGGETEMEKLGVRRKDIYWTVGAYDLVMLCEAPDEASMTAALLRIGGAGNVRTTTLRAFSREEFDQIAARAR